MKPLKFILIGGSLMFTVGLFRLALSTAAPTAQGQPEAQKREPPAGLSTWFPSASG